MEEKGQEERRCNSVGISTSGAGGSSWSGGHGGGDGSSGLSEEKPLLHSPSVSAYTLGCVHIKHYILPSFIAGISHHSQI